MACSLIPGASKVTDTSKETNVFESSAPSGTSESTAIIILSTETTPETSPSTSETSATSSETTASSASDTSRETEITGSSTSGETSETPQLPKDCLAIYEKSPMDEKNYIIYNDASGFAITLSPTDGGLKGVSIPSESNCLTGNLPEGALYFTIFFDELKNFTLRDQNGNFLVLTTDGELILTNKPVNDRYNFWKMEKANGGWTIINVGDPTGRALQYNPATFTFTAGKPAKTNDFVFNFYEVG